MPNISSLPPELLVEILTYFDYFDLKIRLSLTCRSFRKLIMEAPYGQLARTLHREPMRDKKLLPSPSLPERPLPPTATASDNSNSKHGKVYEFYELHPVLSHLYLRPGVDPTKWPVGVDNIGFNTSKGFLPLLETGYAHENVTAPPVDFLVIRTTDGPTPRGSGFIQGCGCDKCVRGEPWGVIDVRDELQQRRRQGRMNKGVSIFEFLEKWMVISKGHLCPPVLTPGYEAPPWKWAQDGGLEFKIGLKGMDTAETMDPLVGLLGKVIPGLDGTREWGDMQGPGSGNVGHQQQHQQQPRGRGRPPASARRETTTGGGDGDGRDGSNGGGGGVVKVGKDTVLQMTVTFKFSNSVPLIKQEESSTSTAVAIRGIKKR